MASLPTSVCSSAPRRSAFCAPSARRRRTYPAACSTPRRSSSGSAAGLLGIGVTVLLDIPINMINRDGGRREGYGRRARGCRRGAGRIISVVLTLIGGVIPSRMAARQDPVTALRARSSRALSGRSRAVAVVCGWRARSRRQGGTRRRRPRQCGVVIVSRDGARNGTIAQLRCLRSSGDRAPLS